VSFFRVILGAAVIWAGVSAAQQPSANSASTALESKIQYLQRNAERNPPDPQITVLSQNDINSYFSSGKLKMPAGVQDLRTELHANEVIGTAHVDFDQVRAGKSENNPLLSLFSGVHDVRVDATAQGQNGQADVQIQSAQLDGIEIPKFALQMFLRKYVQPKYPDIGMETRFELPERIDTAKIEESQVSVTQR
jgi:hypothetical protein